MAFLVRLIAFAVFCAIAGLSLLAIGAFLGFAHPLLDTLNHFQPIWFFGLIGLLVVGLVLVRRQPARSWLIATGFTGFLASAVIVIPEYVAGFVVDPDMLSDGPTYSVMSRNLFGRNYDMQAVAADVAAEDPDIIALQEYFNGQRTDLHGLLVTDYPHFITCTGGQRAEIAIYSRIPFEAGTESSCPDNVASGSNEIGWITAQFKPADGSPFTVMTTHLNWPIQISPLRNGDLSFPQQIEAMSARKQSEFETLAGAVRAVAGPVLLLADFNATPWSYGLRRFADEAGLTRQTHTLPTFPTRFYIGEWTDTWPFLPLDQLMTRGPVAVHGVGAGNPAGSDHRPIMATFSVAGEAEG